MLEIHVDGIADLDRTMARVTAAIRSPKLPHVWKVVAAELRTYPPPPPGSKYVRTGHLRDSWRIGFSQGNSSASLFNATNAATYASYVQGAASEQAAIHRNRWVPASEILARHEAAVVAEWEAEIEAAAR